MLVSGVLDLEMLVIYMKSAGSGQLAD